MKKLLLGLCMLGLLFSFSPVVKAQELSQQELTQQLIVLLLQQIASLQQQINEILAKQSISEQSISVMQNQESREAETKECKELVEKKYYREMPILEKKLESVNKLNTRMERSTWYSIWSSIWDKAAPGILSSEDIADAKSYVNALIYNLKANTFMPDGSWGNASCY